MNRTLFVALLLAAGCVGGIRHTVPDTELAPLAGKGLEAVDAARREEAAARQALEARRADEKAALREVRIAEAAIQRDEATLAIAQLRFEAVQETHDADQMLPAKGRRAEAEHAVAVSKAERTFRRAAHAHAAARTYEAEGAVDVAVARLERAKIEALLGGEQKLQPPQMERKAAFETQLANVQGVLADRTARVATAKAEMDAAEASWKAVAAAKP